MGGLKGALILCPLKSEAVLIDGWVAASLGGTKDRAHASASRNRGTREHKYSRSYYSGYGVAR